MSFFSVNPTENVKALFKKDLMPESNLRFRSFKAINSKLIPDKSFTLTDPAYKL